MVDKVTPEKRSWMMARIRSQNTAPEIKLRKLIFSMGFRYRLHYKGLPGRPDIIFPGKKKVIFMHGCFWHGHPNCRASKLPQTRKDFWESKIHTNKERDKRNIMELEKLNWKVLVVWQCELKNLSNIQEIIRLFLSY
ncbi:MAG: very short patch repair endonuclease [Methylococcaceae bacterium]